MKITEENVIAQLQRKNPAALEYIMDYHGNGVYGLVYRIINDVGSKEDIEECVSDVYAAVWQNCRQYDPLKGSLKTWLLMTAKYKALDYRRRLFREMAAVGEAAEEPRESVMNIVEDKVIGEEEKRQIIAAIKTLGDMDRQIFIKRYFFYEDIENIAQHFGLTRNAVDTRLWRIRNALKEILQQQGKEGLV